MERRLAVEIGEACYHNIWHQAKQARLHEEFVSAITSEREWLSAMSGAHTRAKTPRGPRCQSREHERKKAPLGTGAGFKEESC